MSETTCRCGKPTSGSWLCDGCVKTFAYAIPNVAAYYEDLGTVAAKRARFGVQNATKSSIGKAQPLPVDHRFVSVSGPPERQGRATLAPGTQLRWDAWNTVVSWCRTVMEDQPEIPGPVCVTCLHLSCAAIRRRTWPSNTIRSMCLYLDRQFRWILRQEWAPVMLDEMLNLEHRLGRLVDRPADRWYAGLCSAPTDEEQEEHCQAEIYATVDKGSVTCRACGATHDVASRRTFLLKEAKDYLVTATEAAGALLAWTDYDGSEDKLVDRIRKWRDRGRLEVCGQVEVGGKDRALHRLGDVQALMIEHAQNEQERRMSRPA